MKNILTLILAKAGPILLRSHEEARIENELFELGRNSHIVRWTLAKGFERRLSPLEEAALASEFQNQEVKGQKVTLTKAQLAAMVREKIWTPLNSEITMPDQALQWACNPENLKVLRYSVKASEPAKQGKGAPDLSGPIFIMYDIHHFLSEPTVLRWIKEAYLPIARVDGGLIFVMPQVQIPLDIEKCVLSANLDLPTKEMVEERIKKMFSGFASGSSASLLSAAVQPYLQNPDRMAELVDAAMGLTQLEIGNLLNVGLGSREPDLVAYMQRAKCKVISDSGLMEYFPAASMTDVGGLENLKNWLEHRKDAFSKEAKEFGLEPPRGLLLLGIQGCGKSLGAKAIAGLMKMSLIKLDIGRLMGSLVGQSEANVRRALELAERVAPAVLWIDEIEKGLSGSGSSGQTDGGTTARVMQTILSWLNDRTSPVMVVATANGIKSLPPELLRKGRLDEIFFVDLPNYKERREILDIHLRKRKRDPANFDLDQVVAITEGFSGAELEQLVKSALYPAFTLRQELATHHLLTEAKNTVPLSKTMKSQIDEIREFCATRAVPASPKEVLDPVKHEDNSGYLGTGDSEFMPLPMS